MTAFTREPPTTTTAAAFDALLVAVGHTVTVKPAPKPKRKVNPNFAIYQTGKAHTNDTHRDAPRRATGMKL